MRLSVSGHANAEMKSKKIEVEREVKLLSAF